jgi:hypothetical protein
MSVRIVFPFFSREVLWKISLPYTEALIDASPNVESGWDAGSFATGESWSAAVEFQPTFRSSAGATMTGGRQIEEMKSAAGSRTAGPPGAGRRRAPEPTDSGGSRRPPLPLSQSGQPYDTFPISRRD